MRTPFSSVPMLSRRRAPMWLAVILCWGQMLPAWAVPAQLPLLNRNANPAHPNVMYTLDDSGSMQWQFMPDASRPANVDSYRMAFHHGDIRARVRSNNSGNTPQVIPTRTNDLIAARMRSSAWNKVYYNPEIRYQPWYRADGTQFPNANPRAAWIFTNDQPTVDTATQQANAIANGLAVNLVGEISAPVTTIWCRSNRNTGANNTGTGDANRTGATCGTLTGEELYAPATYYVLSGADNVYTNFTRVRIMDSTVFTRGTGRTDCSVSGGVASCTQAQEYQNFANWFTYYRSRQLLAIGASSRAFAGIDAETGMRVGYGKINKGQTTVDGRANTGTVQRGVRRFVDTGRTEFFNWLFTEGETWSTSGTPLKRALDDVGQYFEWADNRGPWGNTPGTNDDAPHLECRKSYHILMTDGYANESGGARSTARQADFDNSNGPTITGPSGQSYSYAPARPYLKSGGGTMADLAMYYWNRDLRPTLANRVRTDSSNPAFWQHLVNFNVGLGVNGTLSFPDDLDRIRAGTLDWPDLINNHPTAVDDLWHAAVNSRGRYLSAADPEEFATALGGILQEIVDREGSEAGVAAAAATLQAGNRKYVPTYRTAQWSGNVTAYELDARGQQTQELWNAESALPAPASRNIYVGTRGTGTAPRALPFLWDSLPTDMRTDLGAGANANLIDYLRGDRSLEGTTYRRRAGRLGDIVNSQPVFVRGNVDLSYQDLPSGTAGRDTYRDFVHAKRAPTREGVLFVGGNDGMLHGFRDNGGAEVFGFIPRALVSALPALASPSYEHRYFVDGQLTESDAHLSGQWRSVLVGSAGAGARSVFAVDVTNPLSMNANHVLWELDASVNPELGYVMTPIEVGLMKNGRWAAVFGNGPNSASGRARLFVVDLSTGAVLADIPAGASTENGLGGVRVIRDGNRMIVGAYAGDLQGNLWKFDLSSTSSSGWRVSFSGGPLFRALDASNNPRPIVAPPLVFPHPAGGNLVIFGTGKLYEEGDQIDTQVQALYGVWDRQTLVRQANGDIVWTEGSRITDGSTIVQQRFDSTAVNGAGGATFYTVTAEQINWSIHRGWELPLTLAPGHRNLLSPSAFAGLVRFETMAPSETGVVNPCDDSSGGVGYNIVLSPFRGAMVTTPIYDTNGDGIVNASDIAVAAVSTEWDGRDVILTAPPCTTPGGCRPDGSGLPGDPNAQQPVCGPGTILPLALARGGRTVSCVETPAPERWWWRQLTQ
jgi:type IV pilus assembly protein PilY1